MTTSIVSQQRPRSLKVLACGHSNTAASVKYLTSISRDLGTDMLVGLNWRGDANFKTYLSLYEQPKCFAFGKGNDTQFVGVNVVKEETYIQHLEEEKWDIIVLDQGFLYSENPNSEEDLPKLIRIVRQHCPGAQIFCNLRAPYMKGCPYHLFLENYDGNTDKMFSRICDDVATYMAPNQDVSAIIPAGTLIESLKTSKYKHYLYAGDKVHLSVYGSYAAGVMWYAKLTGASVQELIWMPDGMEPEFRDLILQAVPQILADPYKIVDFGAAGSDDDPDKTVMMKTTPSISYVDGGYYIKDDGMLVLQNSMDGVDLCAAVGREQCCVWAFTNDTVERCPYLNYSLWNGGITRICVTKLWSDGVGDIELPVDVGPHSVNIAELVAQQDVQSIGYTYVTVYTSSAEPVSITHFCLMNEQIAG